MSLAASVLTAALALPQPGLVVAYDFARTNFLNWSEGPLTSMIRGGTPTPTEAAGTDGYAAWFVFPAGAPSSGQYVYSSGLGLTPSTTYTVSAVVRMDSGAAPVLGTSGDPNADMSMVLAGDAVTGANSVEALGGGLYRVSTRAATNATIGSANCGVVRYPGQSGRGFRITALSLRTQPGTAYERTTDGQLLLDRSVRLWPAPAARINLLNWSEDLTNAAWSKNHFTNPPTVTLLSGQGQGGRDVSKVVFGAAVSGIAQIVATPVLAGQTLNAGLVMRAETAADVGKKVLIEVKRGGSTNFEGFSIPVTLTADWQTFSVSHTFAAGQPGGFNVNISNNVPTPASGVLVQQASANYGAALLPYEKQTDGVTYDLSQRGMRNLIASSELARTLDTAPPTGWSLQLPTGVSASWSYGVAASGVPYAQVTLTGAVSTAGMAFNVYLSPTGTGGIPVTPGNAYAASVNITQVSGPAFSLQAGAHFWNTTGTYVGTSGGASVTTSGDEPLRMAATVSVPGTAMYATPRVGGLISWPVESSQTRVYRISQPQFEMGAATTYQRSPSHGTMGSSAGPDANDPTWTATGWSLDGVDDVGAANAFAVPDGDFTVIQVFTPLVDSGSTDGKSITKSVSMPGAWRNNFYLGGVNVGGSSVMGWKAGVYHVTGGFNNAGYTYFNVGQVAALQPRVAAFRVRGLVARGELLASATLPAVSQTVLLPAPPVGGIFQGFGTSGNVGLHGFYVWSRALSDAELAQAYRVIRAFNSRRGVSI